MHRLCACLGLGFAPSRRGRVSCRVVSCPVRSLESLLHLLALAHFPSRNFPLGPSSSSFLLLPLSFTLTQPDRERPTYLRPLRVRPQRSLLAEASFFVCVVLFVVDRILLAQKIINPIHHPLLLTCVLCPWTRSTHIVVISFLLLPRALLRIREHQLRPRRSLSLLAISRNHDIRSATTASICDPRPANHLLDYCAIPC